MDPRLDWTAGRRGIPYLDWGLMPGSTWMWTQTGTGPYVNKKRVYWQATRNKYYDGQSWAPGSAVNYNVISFSDVLLMAELLGSIEGVGYFLQHPHEQPTAMVRRRAALT